jgi:3-keto-disaccharide hydrolase
MMRRIILAIAMVLLATGVIAQDGKKSWDFDGDKEGELAQGRINEVGDWKVVADPTAPSKPNVLAQLAKNSGSTFNLTLITGTNYKDVDISVKMKAVAGNEDQGGGLVWRAKDTKNYYVARYNPLENNYRVYKVEKGGRLTLQSADIKQSGDWHTLRATMMGDHIQCYYDGRRYLDVKDSTFSDAGKIGLWTKADAQTHFDDLTVSAM